MDDIGVYNKQLARYVRGYLGLDKRGRDRGEDWQAMVDSVSKSFFGENGGAEDG